ncbi:two-component system response regulator KdpE [Aromatoleum diolicum]|uniref:Two-component system response regulator KdpE n=1 Tax=Aromatoleum diolicum TaxID=75796 RepID=A0ABX1QA93_9RHOO|nr:two-component system response regulator KdpE [Aromatoleum diolicum]NMG74341.1 two-component system response regulator KdpE [Aromatoleum diolicum]
MKDARAPAPVAVIVEDEPHIRHFLRRALESEQWQVSEASTAERGLIEAGSRKPDLVLVDLGLPDRDGLEMIAQLRGWSSVPVLVLSARSDEADKVAALDAGADDYLTKPFGVAELLARVRALLRRATRPQMDGPALVQFGEIEVDLAQRAVTRKGEPVHLTPIEYKLLGHLIANAGRVLTHRQLLSQIWGPNHVEHTHYLRVYMAGLRRKLEPNPGFPAHILTESGIGYRLVL